MMQVIRTLRADRGGLISQPSFYFAIHKLATMYSLTIGIGGEHDLPIPHAFPRFSTQPFRAGRIERHESQFKRGC